MNALALVLFAAALAVGGVGWFTAARQRAGVRGRFAQAFGSDEATGGYDETGMARMLARIERQQAGPQGEPGEFRRLLHRAGWSSRNARAVFYLILIGTPVLSALAALAWVLLARGLDARGMAIVFIAFVLGYMAPRSGVRMLAEARGERLAREAPVWCRLLAMLLESGLNTEQALRSLLADSAEVLPESTKEIAWLIRRLDAGASLPDALGDWQKVLGVPELSDLAGLLQQVSRFGGNARGPLLELALAIEQRQLATVKERINKLAVKMTVVMMVLLFPALLVVLAGPGMLALMRSLRNVAG
jgi:tight adherence protein C